MQPTPNGETAYLLTPIEKFKVTEPVFAPPPRETTPGRTRPLAQSEPNIHLLRKRDPSCRKPDNNEEEVEKIDFKNEGIEAVCQTALTALVMPFKWAPPLTAKVATYVNATLKRTISDKRGKEYPLWQKNTELPPSVGDLDHSFRQTFGWRDSTADPYHATSCRRLMLTQDGLTILFPRACIVACRSQSQSGQPSARTSRERLSLPKFKKPQNATTDEESSTQFDSDELSESEADEEDDRYIFQPLGIESVEMTVFPLGTAVLTITINWLGDKQVTLQQVRTWISLSKFRHKVENVFKGWLLNSDPGALTTAVSKKLAPELGFHVYKALYLRRPTSLFHIANMLISVPICGDHPERPEPMGKGSKRVYHHSLVIVRKELPDQALLDYLFHLRRAYGEENRPPTASLSDGNQKKTDKVLRLRLNRYVALSREGTISLSWPTDKIVENDFEVRTWHKRFFGIYFLLAIHVSGELSMLSELSALSGEAGTILNMTLQEDITLEQLNEIRKSLFAIATLMTRYTLQMGNDNCGGLTEYVEFFSSLRKIFRIKAQRRELREEIQDVLSLVEQSYMQEERKEAQMHTIKKQEEKKLKYLKDQREAESDRRYETIVGAVSSLSIPPLLIAGFFGMSFDQSLGTVRGHNQAIDQLSRRG